MPLTGLVAEARKNSALLKKNTQQIKQEVRHVIDFSSELEQAGREKQQQWQECRHLKQSGGKNFCRRYFSLCAQEKCNTKYINGEEKQLDFKRILRGK
jgi:hypothetical protein